MTTPGGPPVPDVYDSATGAVDLESARRSTPRLEAVHATQLLDSLPEESFDALTRLAAALLGVPASFISIVDADRDFYKSHFGFPEPLAETRELWGPTFCHHTLARDEPLVINDTLADARWQSMPTVTTLGVRAYVGVPLQVDGETIGSFCVIDQRARQWTATEIDTVTQLAKSAGRELMLRGALRVATAQASRAQAAVKAKEGVVAAVAHDLRTPLHVMKLNAALLQRTADAAQLPTTQRLLETIDRMARMTDELLTSHVGAVVDGGTRSSIGVAALMADVVDTMAMIAARSDIALTLGPAPEQAQVKVDYEQMLRVFCNLVGNSVKYCAAGSAVVLSASLTDDEALLAVSDDGPGMVAADASRAFDRGWQGADGRARVDGAGLGLAIVRALVERNGGRVVLSSEPGRGTTVTVGLPCRRPADGAASVG